MALRLPLCLFNRHTPNRHRVKWDGLNFVGTCRFCKSPIRKVEHRGWRKEWMVNAPSPTSLGEAFAGEPPRAERQED